MHKKNKMAKGVAASFLAASMVVPTVAAVLPMSVSAGQVLGETSFDKKALPWHTCESSPAKQTFDISEGCFHVKILTAVGADKEKWDLQVRHRNLSFKANHEYEVSFKAKAKRSGMELCSKIGDIKGDYEYFELGANEMHMGPDMGGKWPEGTCKLTTEYQTFKGTFKPTKDIDAAEWTFHYAKGTQWQGNAQDDDEIWFDDMSIVCKTCPSEWAEGQDSCNANPNESYGATNREYAATAVDESTYMPGGTLVNYISVNQIGYYSNLAKVATLGDNKGDILPNGQSISLSGSYDFELVDAKSNTVVYTGKTTSAKSDQDSADTVCKLDFTEYEKPGRYYLRIKGKDWRSFEFNIGDNIYTDTSHNMLTNALNYFYQNRSGIDIDADYITSGDKGTLSHEGGHKTDKAYVQKQWKNEYLSQDEATTTYASSTITANKGWYDAGDHGKYVVNGGIAVWTLQNMYERAILQKDYDGKFDDKSGVMLIPENGNGVPDVLDECDYELQFMTAMKVDSSEPTWGKYAGLVYHKLHDHKWTGLATKPYDYIKEWKTERIVKPPTLTATLNYSACAAQAARLWKDAGDNKKAEFYLQEAKDAYAAYKKHWYAYDSKTTTHPDLKCECPKEEINEKSLYAPMWQAKGGGPYGDDNALDDAYWAACEIFVSASIMGDSAASEFKSEIDNSEYAYTVSTRMVGGENKDGSFTSFNWGNTASCGSLTLALHSDLLSSSEAAKVKDSILEAAQAYMDEEETQGYGIPYKYDGKGYNDPNNLDPSIIINGYEWGSNSMVINNCIVMAYAYDLTGKKDYMNGVTTGMDYLLGRNPLSFSYITGYGSYKEKNPHHRYWSYELDKSLPMAPDGVLSGGPNAGLQDPYVRALGFVSGKDNNPSQRCFVDSIEAWSTNEVTINWNAPLAWIVSFLQDEASTAGDKPVEDTTGGQTTTGGSNLKVTMWGDANCDDEVNMADAVLIMQSIANPKKYQISTQGKLNGDVADNGDGITSKDALKIQQFMLNLVTTLDPTK